MVAVAMRQPHLDPEAGSGIIFAEPLPLAEPELITPAWEFNSEM